MNKVFLVEASYGSYDDYSTQIIKCFENRQDAEEYSEKYDRVIRKISDFHADAWNIVRDKDYQGERDYENCFHNNIWEKYNYKFNDYNGFKIIEMPFIEHKRKTNLKSLLG